VDDLDVAMWRMTWFSSRTPLPPSRSRPMSARPRPHVNSANGAETGPSLSWDGTTLYFGSNRPGGDGSTDHYLTTRSRN
jgi:Tol biopolymer transport system component